jgi:hypothetical protein
LNQGRLNGAGYVSSIQEIERHTTFLVERHTTFLVETPEGKRPSWRVRCQGEDILKLLLKKGGIRV